MNAIEPTVRDFCIRRLDELSGSGGFDYVQDFARFIPMRVFGMLLGIPEEDQLGIVEHVEAGLRREEGEAQDYSEGFNSGEYYAPFVDYRYENPTEDLITRLMTTQFTDEEGTERTLSREEVLGYLNILAGAGNETTNRLIGWTGKLLGERPEVRHEVAADRSLIPQTVEEALRFEPSSMYVGRYVGRDTEFHGQPVPEGARSSAASAPPTATRRCSSTPTGSTSTGRSAIISPSGTGRTSASAPRWRASRRGLRSTKSSTGSLTGSSMSTTAGWASWPESAVGSRCQ